MSRITFNPSRVKCVAFDCFGTVFDMAGVSRDEIKAYSGHVRKADFSPFDFPASWWDLKLHPDAVTGIAMIQYGGLACVTLSNGDAKLLKHVSDKGVIAWDRIIDLASHRVYKPNVDAYRTVEKETGFRPEETLMVTANPRFGDIEGAAAIGMQSQVIRQPEGLVDIEHLAEVLT